jgi:hypothetical protein
VPGEQLTIAQVAPHRRATTREVREFVERTSEELERRGHRVLVVPRLGSRELEKLLVSEPIDVVHVHEPFAPSTAALALRHSRSLNVGTFHEPAERLMSTQLARPLVEIFFGRLDARTASSPATADLLRRYFPGRYDLIEPASEPGRDWRQVAEEIEAVYRRVVSRRHPQVSIEGERLKELSRRRTIDVDLHMHTDHSPDCATPVEVLLETASDRGLGAIAITDHNEISGALEAREIAERTGKIKVIVGEEVKTAEQGEVIGLFLEEKIPRGMTMAQTIGAIREQGGLVYVPHPFDRFHSVPDYEHLLDVVEDVDILEVFNPRIALTAFNEEAVRFAAKYRIVPGAGSDSHVAQGLGSVRIRLRDFDGPQEFLESMRDADIVRKHKNLVYVQALKLLQTSGRPKAAKRKVANAKPVRGGRQRSERVAAAAARRAARRRGGKA